MNVRTAIEITKEVVQKLSDGEITTIDSLCENLALIIDGCTSIEEQSENKNVWKILSVIYGDNECKAE